MEAACVAVGVLCGVMAGVAGMARPLAAADAESPYRVDWDESVGLWRRSGSGHTIATRELREVHAGPTAADRLLAAGLDGQLADLPVGRVLAALESMQEVAGPQTGCFRWYYEDREIRDTNAAFFIGLPLIALRAEFADELAAPDRVVLDRMLNRLRTWCDREAANPMPRYPNKYLGDLVCAWLLAEQCGVPAPAELPARMLDAARYWREQEWGWGEHMSDTYACVCLDELSMLLMLSKRLPPDVRTAYEQLRDELLRIDDLYAGGPRVPAIRSYAFRKAPTAVSYVDNALCDELEPPPVGQTFAVGHGAAFVVLRRMPRIANDWPEVVDRVCLKGLHARLEELQDAAGHQLRLTYPTEGHPPRRLCIRFLALDPELVPLLTRDGDTSADWSVRHPLGPAARARPPLGVWVWSLGDDLTAAPRIEPLDDGWRLTWNRDADHFVVRVVAEAADPLRVE